ncbi:DUF2986 domain-containing protein [Pseudomonas violetae]
MSICGSGSICKLISLMNLQVGQKKMNRQKKIKQLLKAHAKKASAKLAPAKAKYISKADRLKIEAEAGQEPNTAAES